MNHHTARSETDRIDESGLHRNRELSYQIQLDLLGDRGFVGDSLKLILAATTLTVCGCMESLENQTKKSPNSIIGKTTQDIGQFDPNAGKVVSDSKIHATDPITAPTSAYGPMLEKISKLEIEQAVRLFEAENARYPNNYDEFMEKIIKANSIRLPVLPGGKKYEYDEANHSLVVVDGSAPAP